MLLVNCFNYYRDAIQWIESYLSNHIEATTVYPWTKKEHAAVKRKSTFKRMSMMSSMFGDEKGHSIWTRSSSSLVAFTAGLTLGVIMTSSRMSHLTTSR
jgi:hypothetical protein